MTPSNYYFDTLKKKKYEKNFVIIYDQSEWNACNFIVCRGKLLHTRQQRVIIEFYHVTQFFIVQKIFFNVLKWKYARVKVRFLYKKYFFRFSPIFLFQLSFFSLFISLDTFTWVVHVRRVMRYCARFIYF